MERFESKIRHQKDNEATPIYDKLIRKKIAIFIMNQTFIRAPKIMSKTSTHTI